MTLSNPGAIGERECVLSNRKGWLWLFGFTALYVLLAELARWQMFDVAQSGFVAFWPPTALLLGALTRLAWKHGWKLAAAALVGTLISDLFLHHVTLGVTIAFWLIDCLGAFAGASVLKRYAEAGFDLEQGREVWVLFFGGAVLVPTVVATGAALLLSNPPVLSFTEAWLKVWLGSSLGILIVTPLVLAWSAPEKGIWTSWKRSSCARAVERLGVILATAGVAFLVFSQPGAKAVDSPFFPFWLLLPTLWAGLRFRPRFACLVSVVGMMIVLSRTASGFGPFASPGQSPDNQILLVQGYLGVIALTVLTLSASVCERRSAELEAKASEARLQHFLDNANDLIQWVAPDGTFVFVNRAWRNALGYSEQEVPFLRSSDVLHPDYHRRREQMMRELEEGAPSVQSEMVLLTKDGRHITVETSVSALKVDGVVTCYRGILRDITARKAAETEREQLISQLHRALQEVKTLRGYIPICSCCKKIRTEAGAWKDLEDYLREHTEVEFTHGICSECGRKQFGEYWQEIEAERERQARREAKTDDPNSMP